MKKHLDTLLLVFCFTPSYLWYFKRISTGGEEALSVLLIPVVIFIALSKRKEMLSQQGDTIKRITLYGIALYVFLWIVGCPALIKAALAITLLLHHFRVLSDFGLSSLAYLSLPWVSSFQFFFGYPLRCLVAEGCALTLKGIGLPVYTEGTGLIFRSAQVFVDPPCSGVKMIWAAVILATFLNILYQSSWRRGILTILTALLLALIGNILRGTILFFPEAKLVKWAHWTHEAIGLFSYLGVCLCLLWLLSFLNKPHDQKTHSHYVTPL